MQKNQEGAILREYQTSLIFMTIWRLLLSIVSVSSCALAIAAPTTTTTPKDLSSIKKEITVIQNKISSDEKNLNDLNAQLKKSEKSISSLTLKTKDLSKKITEQEAQLIDYKAKKYTYDAEIKAQQETLEKLISANYSLQRQGRAGIYFSGNSRDETQRFLKYYQALDASVIQQIGEIRKTIEKLNQVMSAISVKTTQLQHSFKDQTKQLTAIQKAQKYRQSAVSSINRTLNTNRKVLDQLLQDREQLTKLVTHLTETSTKTATIPKTTTTKTTPLPSTTSTTPIAQKATGPIAGTTSLSNLNFASQKGKLGWPTAGLVKYLFQEPMANESVRWQGDLIEAKEGTPVHAIYGGKVIYADWLRGYGLLVIVDHGNHYLSLYARNDTLNRKVGDIVKTGDVIGTVGQSGGFQQPALYFELRHNAEAINPKSWFKS